MKQAAVCLMGINFLKVHVTHNGAGEQCSKHSICQTGKQQRRAAITPYNSIHAGLLQLLFEYCSVYFLMY